MSFQYKAQILVELSQIQNLYISALYRPLTVWRLLLIQNRADFLENPLQNSICSFICEIKRDKQAFSACLSLLSMGYEKDGFAFLIDGFELSNLTNLDNISFS